MGKQAVLHPPKAKLLINQRVVEGNAFSILLIPKQVLPTRFIKTEASAPPPHSPVPIGATALRLIGIDIFLGMWALFVELADFYLYSNIFSHLFSL